MGGAQMACPPVRARLTLPRSGGQCLPQTASPRCGNFAARAGWLRDAGTEQRNLPENLRIRLESVLVRLSDLGVGAQGWAFRENRRTEFPPMANLVSA